MTATARDTRLGTIARAIALMDVLAPADLARHLAQTDIRDHLKDDPAALRSLLAEAGSTGSVFSAWKASQQILRAAGLSY